jgi:hypothetical protein
MRENEVGMKDNLADPARSVFDIRAPDSAQGVIVAIFDGLLTS